MKISEIIQNINELNKIKKEKKLTDEQQKLLQKYRKLYLENFRNNFKNILKNTKVVNEKGEDITPNKRKGKK